MGFVLPSLQWCSSFILGRRIWFELSTVYKSGYATVGASVLLTAAAWIIGISI